MSWARSASSFFSDNTHFTPRPYPLNVVGIRQNILALLSSKVRSEPKRTFYPALCLCSLYCTPSLARRGVQGGLLVTMGLPQGRMVTIPERLIDDLCRLNYVSPTEIPRLTIGKRDQPVELLEGLRCPIVLRLESGWWKDKAFDLDQISKYTPAKIAFDIASVASNGDFTHIDNDTALAPDILPRTAADGGYGNFDIIYGPSHACFSALHHATHAM